jgi:hypothetical protein
MSLLNIILRVEIISIYIKIIHSFKHSNDNLLKI